MDDRAREIEADKLEGMVRSGDTNALQNELVKLHEADPHGFNKTVDMLKQRNDADLTKDGTLPKVEISKEWFGFGDVEQVVLKDSADTGGKKTEVFETAAHRARENEEDPQSLGRAFKNMTEQGQWTDMADFQKDASHKTGFESTGMPGVVTLNQMDNQGGRTVGALDQSANQTMTTADEQAILDWADKQRQNRP